VHEEFKQRLLPRVAAIRVGDGLASDVDMGPVSSQVQFDKVMSYFEPGTLSGTVLTGGVALPGHGYFIAPTVIDAPDPESAIAQEEIFGPVVALLPVSNLDEAITLANATNYGLCAAIFTRTEADALRFARNVDAGRVGVNVPTSVGDQTVPGGGRKNSGRGEYEGADAGILFFTHLKPIFLNPKEG
jgi:acyl-CoA reductase-like NAD-dependent aldehyde dehydrogenase